MKKVIAITFCLATLGCSCAFAKAWWLQGNDDTETTSTTNTGKRTNGSNANDSISTSDYCGESYSNVPGASGHGSFDDFNELKRPY